jgi:hypothetical protein
MKKTVFLIILNFYLINSLLAMSPEYEKQLYLGCYPDSKKYLGKSRAQEYCSCTTTMLSKKYTDKEIDKIFDQSPEDITKDTEFAVNHCEKNKTAL